MENFLAVIKVTQLINGNKKHHVIVCRLVKRPTRARPPVPIVGVVRGPREVGCMALGMDSFPECSGRLKG